MYNGRPVGQLEHTLPLPRTVSGDIAQNTNHKTNEYQYTIREIITLITKQLCMKLIIILLKTA